MFSKIKYSVFILTLFSCSGNNESSLKPVGLSQIETVTIESGDLTITFIDNNKWGEVHRAGYNGIAELIHSEQDSNLFVPFYAGFNLEHILGGDSLSQLFEPRKHPMMLFRKSKTEVLLYQEATPLSSVESLTEFKVVEPHYIDITFRCVFHDSEFFKHDYAGLFWASYINKPADKKIYFKGIKEDARDASWIGAYSVKHGQESTHMGIEDEHNFFFADNFNATLVNNFSRYRYTDTFYYGKFHNMAVAYLFDSDEVIRFSQSPTGGGETNPAWDFQYLIPSLKTGKEYSFNSRMIYKPFQGAKDLAIEYENWINQ